MRSRVGILSFMNGGFSIDAAGESASLPFPQEWRFVIVVPSEQTRIYGKEEKRRLANISRHPRSGMQEQMLSAREEMVGGLRSGDVSRFGSALSRLDQLTGEIFSQVQGGIYTNPLVSEGLGIAFSAGALGGGQSSWGPGFFALASDEDSSRRIAMEMAGFLNAKGGGDVYCSGVRNTGARIGAVED